jgi:hypothetical protein
MDGSRTTGGGRMRWTVFSALAAASCGAMLFGGYVPMTPLLVDAIMVAIAATGSHAVMGLMEAGD